MKVPEIIFDMAEISDRIEHETKLLKEWFKKDYSESDIRVKCDFNSILFVLSIEIEVLMGEEVTDGLTNNRMFFKSRPIRLMERDLRNKSLMNAFYKEFNPSLRKMIQGAFNLHYLEQKQKAGVL